ncbi:MAG: hypothetical protein Q3M24_06595 [Candidatus Electrothrix aestuarii]|uniref:Uncharacterized protein n=1 Tax=Candidatus Electrothrix aestuarii TaxID=3062594 RepID=A0AAU8LXX5_9BACT|nr:hypothetical protein [Candidatus Electrothrix aestuarii]
MGAAYFIVIDKENVDFDLFVNGKHVAKSSRGLAKFCSQHGLQTIDDFYSQDPSELMEWDEDIEIPEREVKWFEADIGINWINELVAKLKSESSTLSIDPIIEDLNEYKGVLENAKRVDAKWHFTLDF